MDNNEYLSHHGIKGQKWGVEHGPPYPVRRGAGGAPKKTSIVKSRLSEAMAKRKEAKAVKREETAAEKHEKLRKEVINNPKKIYKNRDQFSQKELEEMIKRIEFDRKIKDVKIEEVKRGIDSYKRFQSVMNTTASLASNVQSIYNFAANVNNAFIDSGKSTGKKWTVLGQNSGDQKKQEDKDPKGKK